jgi:general L-amino acid transport system permease protein
MAMTTLPNVRPPFYRDTKVIGIILQVVFAILMLLFGWLLYTNMMSELARINNTAGSPLTWNFLGQTAGFAISEGPVFRAEESYFRAFLVGFANTLRVSLVGIVLATMLGTVVGIARVSNNWLLSKIAHVYTDIFRSTPLLVQLLFWYFGVVAALPDISEAGELGNLGFLSNRGIFVTWPYLSQTGAPWLWWLLAALIAGGVAAWLRRRSLEHSGRPGGGFLLGLFVFLAAAILGFFFVQSSARMPDNVTYELRRGDRGTLYVDGNGNQQYDAGADVTLAYVPITLLDADGQPLAQERTDGNGDFRFFDLPAEGASLTWETPPPVVVSEPLRQGFNFRGGLSLTPEYAALLLGLVMYTGAFIAEIVRAGLNAVPKGQWEASRAVGLPAGKTLRLIVLPQALRVIIPPLTSQYLNLVKNSSLAIAIGYPDMFYVTRIIVNQSGAEVQMILVVMATYLSISLLVSALMNWYNKHMAIVER